MSADWMSKLEHVTSEAVAHEQRFITADDFSRDAHAAKYRGELRRQANAFERLFALLNDPANEQRLVDAELHGFPALCGVVRFIEADPIIARALADGSFTVRSRQTVGVAVKIKMAKLGWSATGQKGTVRGARHFAKAERFVDTSVPMGTSARALAALDDVVAIGDADERESTGRELMDALAAARRAEGRVF